MIHAFVDCDVIIDLLTQRTPFFHDSSLIFQLALEDKLQLFTSPLAISNIHYMLRKTKTESQTRHAIKQLLSIVDISEMNKSTVVNALESEMKDFEDAMQSYSARPLSCDYIITRNTKDYKKSVLEAKTPSEILSLIQS